MTGTAMDESRIEDGYLELVQGLESRFGQSEGRALAEHFLGAERADFYWQARRRERFLGAYESLDDDEDRALDRVAIIGFWQGRWFVATCLVNGDGAVDSLIAWRHFAQASDAEKAFGNAH